MHPRQNIGTRAAKDLISGAVVSLVSIAFYVSAATLLFQGPLRPHLSTAIGAALFGGALLAIFQAARGSLELASVGPEPVTVPVIAGLTAWVAAQCSPQSLLPTAVAALGVTALCIGLVWFVLGRMRAGDVIRYIPYPVIGGFLASVGWLMLAGGVAVVLGRSFAVRDIPDLVTGQQGLQLLAGAIIGLALWWATLKIKHVLVLPGLIVFFVVLVHAWLGFAGVSIEAARAQGWFNLEFDQAMFLSPLAPQTFALVDWSVIAGHAGTIMTAVILSVVALLLSDSSLEVAFEERADFNRDLRLLGGANMLLGLAGGVTGGVSISRSILNQQAGAVSRHSGLAKAAFCILAMFWGGPVLSLVPRPLLGGILMYIGIGMLKFWLIDGRSKLARNDYFAVLAILAITIGVGYLPAVVVGIVICCFDFAVSSARTGPVRRTFSRNEWPGKVERSAIESAALQKDGEKMRIVELQGALFFGSIRRLAGDLESLLAAGEKPDRLVIDFRRVASMDSSAAQAMSRVLKVAGRFAVPVTFTSCNERVLALLRANGCIYPGGPDIMEDIDQAVVQWDDEKLRAHATSSAPLEEWLAAELGGSGAVQELLSWLEARQLEPGDVLFRENEPADSLYLVQKGRLNLTVQHKGATFNIRSIQAGGTVGEMGLYRLRDRSATVTAGEPSSVLRMSDTTMRSIEASSPALALSLHKLFVRLLASRLEHSNAQLKALSS